MRWFKLFFLRVAFIVVCASGNATPAATIPDDWFNRPPTAERLKTVQASAATHGWQAVADRIFAGSVRAYELRQEDPALAWYYVARWSEIFGQSQANAGRQWLERLKNADAIHSNINLRDILSLPDAPIMSLLKPDTLGWLLEDRAFSESFFALVSAYDCLPRSLAIIQSLRELDVAQFNTYAQLALALALVYDEEPPTHWPHWQVSTNVLPRKLPDAVDAFRFLVDADKRRVTLQRLDALTAGELKFAVDLSASFPDLLWAQQNVRYSLADWVKSYESVRYRTERVEDKKYVWPGSYYDLKDIRGEGGICVDQAYFATQAGKARGVPTLLFSGAGRDGRHAWFGYLGPGRKWIMDGGRYAEQRYVTGVTYDPQTWMPLSDHELGFLSEGFRRLPPYKQSWAHQVFAEAYLNLGKKPEAAAAARRAVNYERRNLEAWELLLRSSEGAPPRAREGLLREAAQAMQLYPDLNGRFIRELASSLRARGEGSAADLEERALVRRGNVGGRTDVGVDQAVLLMEQASAADLLRVYRQVLQKYGRAGGMDFYDRVTRPLVVRLIEQKRKGDVAQVLAVTKSELKPEAGSQLEREMAELSKAAK